MLAGGVDLHPNSVDTAHNNLIQCGLQLALVHIVLVLPHSYRLGIYLYQLGQWVHKAATNGNRPPDGDIIIGKLLAGHLRGRIYRGSGFGNDKYLYIFGKTDIIPDKILRLPAGGSVADGYSFNFVGIYQG